jgi:hypothetical protein
VKVYADVFADAARLLVAPPRRTRSADVNQSVRF